MLYEDDRIVRLRRTLPQVVAVIWLPACFLFGLFNREFLPEKYFYDDAVIQRHLSRSASASEDNFKTMAAIYEYFGAAGHPKAVAAITMLAFFLLLLRCASWHDMMRFGWYETAVFCFSALACAIYLAQYSKESLSLLLVLILAWLPRHIVFDLVFVALCCTYAYFVREYWSLVAGLYLALRTCLAASRRSIVLPIAISIAIVGFAYGIDVFFGLDLNSFREDVAQWRANSQDAQSEIQSYLPTGSPDLAAGNAGVTLIFLILPIPLLLDPSLTYLAFTVAISSMWGALILALVKGCRRGWFTADHRMARATALILAMVAVQAVFEPDYGSYLKHLAPLLPLFLLVASGANRASSAMPVSNSTTYTSALTPNA